MNRTILFMPKLQPNPNRNSNPSWCYTAPRPPNTIIHKCVPLDATKPDPNMVIFFIQLLGQFNKSRRIQ